MNSVAPSGMTKANLLELELDRSGVHPGDGIRDVVANAKGLIFGLPRKVNEQRVGVTINNFRSPFFRGVDHANGLPVGVSSS